MELKNRKFVRIANSQGFFIPVEQTAERVGGGLEIGKRYDLAITETTTTEEGDE